jgi:release factor glutamine methyltransferase
MIIIGALSEAEKQLKKAGIPSWQLDAKLLLCDVLGVDKPYLLAHDSQTLTTAQHKQFEGYLQRRLDREPVCYITNKLEFYGIEFYVDNRVLSPRVETELVAEQAIKNAPKNSRLIDIGTGSGAIAIAIAKHRPDLHITATEVSAKALEVAQLNAENILGSDHKIVFIEADIWDGVDGQFETVVTNLPYVSEDYKPRMKPEVQKEPAIALFGGPGDGLNLYRRFYADLSSHIKPGSRVYHESDPWQHEALIGLAKAAGLKPILEDYLILGLKAS